MFNTFSGTVEALYERASHVDPHQFPAEAVQLVRRLIVFDGAILGIRSGDRTLIRNVALDRPATVHGCAPQHGTDDDVLPDDLFANAFFWEMARPVTFDWKDLERAQAGTDSNPAEQRNLRKLLGYGDASGDHLNARWIVLYRADNGSFGEQDSAILHALWPHVRQALTFNLDRALYRSDPDRSAHATALVNSRGLIEACDRKMTDLMQLEWPDCNGRILPCAAVTALLERGHYRGERIELAGSPKFGYIVCTGKRNPLLSALASSELSAAGRFARGMTHKEIAAHLKVSPHTVRNQLAHIYQKLGVHDKVKSAAGIFR